MTTASDSPTLLDEDVDGAMPTIPLQQLNVLPPSPTASVPSKVTKALMEHDGLSLETALVIEAAQADIAANYPLQRLIFPTPVGKVVAVSLRLNTAMVMPAAFNPRDAAARKRQVALDRRRGRPWEADFGLPKASLHNGPECVLEIDSRVQLDHWTRWERTRLADPTLREWIGEATVLEPILVQPTRFVSPDGATIALVAQDGSRRVTNALDRMRPAVQVDPLLALAHCNNGPLRMMTAEDVKQLRRANLYPGTDNPAPLFPASRSDADIEAWAEDLHPEVAAFHRARTVTAHVIIGFEPFNDELGNPMGDITEAVDALLRQKHVMNARPKEWTRGDNSVLIGTRAVARLEETDERHPVTRRVVPVLDEEAASVLAGNTLVEEARNDNGSRRFRDPLHALATLAAVLGAPAAGSAAAKAVGATLAEWRQKNSPKSRATIAADMAVHILGLDEDEVAQVVASLAGLLHGREFRDPDIKLPDGRTWHYLLDDFTIEEVCKKATTEIASGQSGAWSVLLSLYGGLALIVNPDATSEGATWTRLTQTGRGVGDNHSTPDAIVRLMAGTTHGQELLGEAARQVAARLESGSAAPMVSLTINRPGEAPTPITEKDIRTEWHPTGGTTTSTTRPAATADRYTQYQLKLQAVQRQASTLQQQLDDIQAMIDENSAVLWTTRGVQPEITTVLIDIAMATQRFAMIGQQVWTMNASGQPALPSPDGDGDDGDLLPGVE